MNFELSKPQQLLRETTRASLCKACPTKRVRELMLTDTAFDAEIADVILFLVRQGKDLAVVAVPRGTPGMTIAATPPLDATRKLYDVALKDVLITDAQVLAVGDPARAALEHAAQVATVAV